MDLQPAPTGSKLITSNYLINLHMRMQQVPAHLCIYHLDPFGSCAAWLVAAEMANQTPEIHMTKRCPLSYNNFGNPLHH